LTLIKTSSHSQKTDFFPPISQYSMPGYSGTPLAKKLGIKPGFRVRTKNAPADYQELLSPIPDDVTISNSIRTKINIWHLFTKSRNELSKSTFLAMDQIEQDGMIWVSWPKKSSGVESDVTEGVIRDVILPMGLVDVKVCAVDDVWSGLKLVIRKQNRK